MVKFKVGDKVKVVHGLSENRTYDGGLHINPDMVRKEGKILTIESILRTNRYFVEEDSYIWSDSMFIPFNEEKGIKIQDIDFSKDAIYRSIMWNAYIFVKDARMETVGNTQLFLNSRVEKIDLKVMKLYDMIEPNGEIKDRKVKIICDVIKGDTDLLPEQVKYFNEFQNVKNLLEQITTIYDLKVAVNIILKSDFYCLED